MGVVYLEESAGVVKRRTHQNVIPTDTTRHKYILDQTGGVSFTYDYNETTGKYEINSIDLKEATQPYIFTIPNNTQGASIDPITGDITISSSFSGNNLTVTLEPLYNVPVGAPRQYYTDTKTAAKPTFTIDNIAPPDSPTLTSVTLSIAYKYTSTVIEAAGTTSSPTTFKLTKTFSDQSSQEIIGYSNVRQALQNLTVSTTNCSFDESSGDVTIGANTTSGSRTIKVTFSNSTYEELAVQGKEITWIQTSQEVVNNYATALEYRLGESSTIIPYVKSNSSHNTWVTYSNYDSNTPRVSYTFSADPINTNGLSINASNGILTYDLASVISSLEGGQVFYSTYIFDRGDHASKEPFQTTVTASSTKGDLTYQLIPRVYDQTTGSGNIKLDTLIGNITWTEIQSSDITSVTDTYGYSDGTKRGGTVTTSSKDNKSLRYVDVTDAVDSNGLLYFKLDSNHTGVCHILQLATGTFPETSFNIKSTSFDVVMSQWIYRSTDSNDGLIAIYKPITGIESNTNINHANDHIFLILINCPNETIYVKTQTQ